MKLRKPDKVITVYWTKRELINIRADILRLAELVGTEYGRETILEKCLKGIEALEAYEKGDAKMAELYEIMNAQNETEPMV